MIYHIVTEKDLRSRMTGTSYLPSNYDADGFVHCSLDISVIPVANEYYAQVNEKLLLLKIDPSKLEAEMKYESAAPVQGMGMAHAASSPVFPHVYGAINSSAIDGIGVLIKTANGYAWPEKFYILDGYFKKDDIVSNE